MTKEEKDRKAGTERRKELTETVSSFLKKLFYN
jgi:hypothetical protein